MFNSWWKVILHNQDTLFMLSLAYSRRENNDNFYQAKQTWPGLPDSWLYSKIRWRCLRTGPLRFYFFALVQTLETFKVVGTGFLPSMSENSKTVQKGTEFVEVTEPPEQLGIIWWVTLESPWGHPGVTLGSPWDPFSPSLWYNCCFPGYGSKYHSHSESWILLPGCWPQTAPVWCPVCSVSASIPASHSGSCGSPGVLCLLVTRQCLEWQLKSKKKGRKLKALSGLFRAFFWVLEMAKAQVLLSH